MYDTASLTLVFIYEHQFIGQHFISCILKALHKPTSQCFNPDAVHILTTSFPTIHSLIASVY